MTHTGTTKRVCVLGSHAWPRLRDAAHPMTPNLGQGGCAALEDAVVLARSVATAAASGFTPAASVAARQAAIEGALRAYEQERKARTTVLTVRSHVIGALLQIPLPPVSAARRLFRAHALASGANHPLALRALQVIWVRNLYVSSKVFSPAHFLDHTLYDCGTLPAPLQPAATATATAPAASRAAA